MAELMNLAREDDRIELVVGDLGYGVVEPFVEAFPSRFLNVGVAEQNMTGVATGLALTGSIVFTYSIGNFPTLRCLEQIRNDVCYHSADVKIVCVGGGLAYGPLGFSHHATEDLAILRSLPGILVASPGDPTEAAEVTRWIARTPGPAYLRLGKTGEPRIHDRDVSLPPGSSVVLVEGLDVALLVTGSLLTAALEAAELLERSGVSARVASLPWITPIDSTVVERAAAETRLIVTIEEHSVIGGLGGAVAELLSDMADRPRLLRIGLPNEFSTIGSQEYLRNLHGLTPSAIAGRVRAALDQPSG